MAGYGSRGIFPAGTDPTQAIAPSPVPTPAPAAGPQVASASQLAAGHAISFDDPITGNPGVLIKLRDGSIVAFDPMNGGQAVAGPTNVPLAKVPIHIDKATGTITLTAG